MSHAETESFVSIYSPLSWTMVINTTAMLQADSQKRKKKSSGLISKKSTSVSDVSPRKTHQNQQLTPSVEMQKKNPIVQSLHHRDCKAETDND